MAGELQIKKSATTTTAVSLAADLTNNSVGGGTNQVDNSTDKYPFALLTFSNPGTFGAAPTNLSAVNVFMVRDDVDGTTDDSAAPTGSDVESAEWIGAFAIYDTDEQQIKTISVDLRGALKFRLFIENKTGQTISAGAGTECTVKCTPWTYAPAP